MMKDINILVTGAGSVMGQSILKAIDCIKIENNLNVYLTNSDTLGASFYFDHLKNCKIVENLIVPLANDDKYLNSISDYVQKYNIDIVFPGTQHELRKLSLFHDKHNNVGALKPDIVELFIDKDKTAKLFQKYNIRFPKSVMLDTYIKSEYSNEKIIIKPKTNSASRDISLIDTKEKYDDVVKNIVDAKIDLSEYVVQEYLDGLEYTCGCYVDKYTKEINTIIFERTLTLDGATGYGKIIANDRVKDYVTKIAKAVTLEGMEYGHFNVQFRIVNDEPICFEVNGRLSSTEAPKAKFGFNSVAAYISNIALEKSYNNFDVKKSGQFLRYYEEVYFEDNHI